MYLYLIFIILIILLIILYLYSLKIEKFEEDKIYEIKIELKNGTDYIYKLKHSEVCTETQCELKIENLSIDIDELENNEIVNIRVFDGENEVKSSTKTNQKENGENISVIKCNENNYNLGLYNKYNENNGINYQISKIPNIVNLNKYFFGQNTEYNKLLEKLNIKKNFNYNINLL